MKNVIIYTRVSTEEQKANFSLRAQKERLVTYCKIKGYNVLAHFEDSCSGKTFNRPEYQSMIKYIQNNKGTVDKLLFVKWDRFARNATEGLAMIDMLKKLNIIADATEQSLDLTVPENKLILAMYLMAPEVENDRRALNTSSGMIKAKEEGRWVAGAPFGYKCSRDNKGVLIKSDNAELVKEAFTLYASGIYGKEEIRMKLRKKGMTLSRSAFWKMFSSIVYSGFIYIPAYGNKADQIVKGMHDGIISLELFNKVQQIAKGKKMIKSKPVKAINELPLRGFLQCPKCDRNLTGSASKGNGGKYYYYHCQKGCDARFKADSLNNSFSEWIDDLSIKPEIMDLYIEVMRDIFKTNEGDKEKEIGQLDKTIAEKEILLNKSLEKFLTGDIEKYAYNTYNSNVTDTVNELKLRKQSLEQSDSSFDIYLSYGFFLLGNMKGYFNEVNVEGKQKFLGSIFPEKLQISGNGYRTNGENVLIDLICNTGKNLNINKNKQASKNADLFRVVAPTRIELVSKV